MIGDVLLTTGPFFLACYLLLCRVVPLRISRCLTSNFLILFAWVVAGRPLDDKQQGSASHTSQWTAEPLRGSQCLVRPSSPAQSRATREPDRARARRLSGRYLSDSLHNLCCAARSGKPSAWKYRKCADARLADG
ncbi:hypothetical protein B0T26DRAFT_349521 [Lasiosphaeria miniovina]|uniref:Uncharacterized protein n=1 Tax=Lasiosphaeria miniovina TaxID=1954250 RepID=A0AA40AC28_9PEZI|nr:uncharacterized protein B0T26DRAFT_349521 [Lasiosphaeria miniovina]KAK0712960.1 hypothetical protein B0T26DRAFT_349521 [Lasiosphaeria miniovina]